MPDPITALIDAAIAVARSECGAAAQIRGDGTAEAFDDWPEMDDLLAALDAARPGWREEARDA